MEDRWTPEHVLSLAPDAPSRKAASKLSAPAPWSATGSDDRALWGQCQGSGGTPYRTAVELAGPAYQCSCPSRKFPCKHALGLLLLWAARGTGQGQAPEWATGWLDARQEKERQLQDRREQQRQGAEQDGGAEEPADTAARLAAAKRAARRSERVAAGAAELQARLADQLRAGLADAPQQGPAAWAGVAARMVDAQAPGLAARARELGTVPASGPGWPSRLLEEYGLLHLLAAGYQRVDSLPAGLAATVRARVGFTVDTAEVLRGPVVRDHWLVLGSSDSGDERLTTRRIWLRGSRSGQPALLLSFGRPGSAPDLALPTGLRLDAEVAFHPGARPLRAALGTRFSAPSVPSPAEAVPPGLRLEAALDAYGRALSDDPWLDSWPVVLERVVPLPGALGWELADHSGPAPVAIPVDRRSTPDSGLWRLAAVSGGRPLTLFGECGHRGFTPITAWYHEETSGDPRRIRTLGVTA
ncbi:SWIM zinc finger family protein [Streptacidiphilus sp. P02-A3a]|uniref:SWIM zinc finger family protein n=1 Tax=Streptacidiphilus sp. P02-A3a TaxID=2704468 RepID=UPI0015F7AB2D|nr:SWIM zinc finger family protein [Streptacidiphilus sp. P02-A3a]QMU72665.1 SWIM zinc finger family protein [Streptacidiphilus sp. P02-A3a]